MLITLKYSELMLEKIAAATPSQRQRFHLTQLGLALGGEHALSLSMGYSNAAFTELEARSAATGKDYIVRFAPSALHIVGFSRDRWEHRVRVMGPAGLVYETPDNAPTGRSPVSNRTTTQIGRASCRERV